MTMTNNKPKETSGPTAPLQVKLKQPYQITCNQERKCYTMRKYSMMWIVVAVFAFAVMSGGCGGGGGGELVPAPLPEPIPQRPTTVPQAELDRIVGTWTAIRGNGIIKMNGVQRNAVLESGVIIIKDLALLEDFQIANYKVKAKQLTDMTWKIILPNGERQPLQSLNKSPMDVTMSKMADGYFWMPHKPQEGVNIHATISFLSDTKIRVNEQGRITSGAQAMEYSTIYEMEKK